MCVALIARAVEMGSSNRSAVREQREEPISTAAEQSRRAERGGSARAAAAIDRSRAERTAKGEQRGQEGSNKRSQQLQQRRLALAHFARSAAAARLRGLGKESDSTNLTAFVRHNSTKGETTFASKSMQHREIHMRM